MNWHQNIINIFNFDVKIWSIYLFMTSKIGHIFFFDVKISWFDVIIHSWRQNMISIFKFEIKISTFDVIKSYWRQNIVSILSIDVKFSSLFLFLTSEIVITPIKRFVCCVVFIIDLTSNKNRILTSKWDFYFLFWRQNVIFLFLISMLKYSFYFKCQVFYFIFNKSEEIF